MNLMQAIKRQNEWRLAAVRKRLAAEINANSRAINRFYRKYPYCETCKRRRPVEHTCT